MSKARTCSQCGATLNNDAPEGFCAACMLEGALRLGADVPLVGDDVRSLTSSHPLRFTDYELLDEIARGGMGIVYRARQISLDRIVAVKLILIGRFAEKAAVRRFKAEAAAAAKLRHPNIVAIHEIGEEGGQHFFSMDHVEGTNLADFIRERPISIRQTAQLLETIAEALHYAHEQGIVHRDLKPSNILIDGLLEPRITDFGLARDLKADSDLTLTGQMLGSPNYISPEQASGKTAVGVPSDIYSLGAILYHLLSGRPPFAAETITETLQQVATTEAISPRRLNPGIPRDLETICLKCLEKEPAKRYVTAVALAEDLGRFLDDAPIAARPVSKMEGAWRWCRRKPIVAGLTAAVFLSFVIGFIGVFWQWRRAEQHADQSRHNLYAANMNLAQAALETGNTGHAQDILRKYLPQKGQKDLRGWEWRYAWDQCRSDELFTLESAGVTVSTLAFTTNAALLAAGSRGGTVVLWDFPNKKPIRILTQSDAVHGLAFSSNDKELIVGTSDGQVTFWSSETWQRVATLTNLSRIRSLRVSPDGKLLVVSSTPFLTLWDLADRRQIQRLELLRDSDFIPAGAAFSPDSSLLAYNRGDGTIVLRDLAKAKTIGELQGHEHYVTALAFSSDGAILVSGSRDRTVRVWDVSSQKELRSLGPLPGWIGSVAFSPDGALLAVVGAGQRVRLFETGSWQEVSNLKGHTEEIWAAAFAPDGRTLMTGSKDETIKGWAIGTQRQPVWQPLPSDVTAVVPLTGTRFLYMVHSNRTYSVWRTDPLAEAGRYRFPIRGAIASSTVSPDGRLWAAATTNGLLKIFDHVKKELIAELPFPGSSSAKLAFSYDAQILAGVANDRTCRVWRITVGTASEITAFATIAPAVKKPKFSRSGHLVGILTSAGAVEVWSIASALANTETPGAKKISTVGSGQWLAEDVVFSRDHALAVTASASGRVNVWDLKTERQIADIGGQLNSTFSVTLSQDERRLAACGGDGTVKLWDMQTKQEVASLKLHKHSLSRVEFSSDDDSLFVTAEDRIFVLRAPKDADDPSSKRSKESPSRPSAVLSERAKLLQRLNRLTEAAAGNLAAFGLPQRDPKTPATLVDLSLFYNASLEGKDPSLLAAGSDQSIQTGRKRLNEIEFDVRGVIRLDSSNPAYEDLIFPRHVDGIKVFQKCRRLHFLHFVFSPEREGMKVGSYLIHYADGKTRNIPVGYGEDLRTWGHMDLKSQLKNTNAAIAWTGFSRTASPVRLFKMTWENPRSDAQIETIDFISNRTQSAPVLVAVTVEP